MQLLSIRTLRLADPFALATEPADTIRIQASQKDRHALLYPTAGFLTSLLLTNGPQVNKKEVLQLLILLWRAKMTWFEFSHF